MLNFFHWNLSCCVLVFLAVGWCHGQGNDCPEGCDTHKCECTKTSSDHTLVACEELTEGFFDCLDESVREFQLHRSSLVSISQKDLENATKLEKLDISGNENFTTIEKDALVGLDNLHYLYLDHNALFDLEGRLFPVHLDEVRLNNNNITKIETDVFAELGITHLTLSHNRLEDFKCPQLDHLIVLELHGNLLTSIKDESFHDCPNVQELHLGANRIKEVEIKWSVIPGLIFLDLRFNEIETLGTEFDTSLKTLRYLLAGRNALRELPRLPPSLVGLDLNGNHIETIRMGAFRNLTYLSYLEMSDMPRLREVEEGAFDGTVSLFSLKLQNNRNLRFLPYHPWSSSAELREIHLSSNGIASFRRELFSTLDDLWVAVIAGNPLLCNCEISWIREEMDSPDNEWVRPWINGTEAVVCQSPENIRDFYVSSLNLDDLTCDLAVVEEVSTRKTSNAIILEAMLSRGVPSTSWFLPDGRHIIAHRNVPPVLTAHSDPVPEELLFENQTVLARLTIFTSNFDPGPYVLQSVNAGGPINHTFVVDSGPPTTSPAPSGGSSGGGMIAIVVIVSIVAVVALGVGGFFAFRYFRSRRQNRYLQVDE